MPCDAVEGETQAMMQQLLPFAPRVLSWLIFAGPPCQGDCFCQGGQREIAARSNTRPSVKTLYSRSSCTLLLLLLELSARQRGLLQAATVPMLLLCALWSTLSELIPGTPIIQHAQPTFTGALLLAAG